jgi:murein DD-endopeptidase MepM/ murein hydrolase activator NlpD
MAFSRTVVFHPDPDGKTWRGLVGIDLATRPGEYIVTIEASRPAGPALTAIHRLRVSRTLFPTRRLQVAEPYVNPPAGMVERIQREAQRLRALFEYVTPRRWDGPFLAPVNDNPTNNFGARSVFNGQPRNPHAGVDFTSPEGTPVRAPNAGQIVLAEDLFFTGNTVIVDHGLGLYSLFAHLSRIDVEHGQAVEPGETVGLVGATGRATGPHLHWAVRLSGARVNPFSLIAALETSAATQASQR